MAQVVVKRGRGFVKEWQPRTGKDQKGFQLVETGDMEDAMIFNCENDARRFLRCDRTIVSFYQPELKKEY